MESPGETWADTEAAVLKTFATSLKFSDGSQSVMVLLTPIQIHLMIRMQMYIFNSVNMIMMVVSDVMFNIDPDNHFHASIPTDTKYYSDEQFVREVKSVSDLSFIHFNARSLNKNIQKN